MVSIKDPWTKTGWSRTSSDQGRENFRNFGLARTRTETVLEIPDQLGPGPRKFEESRTNSDQGQQNFENLGPIRTGRSLDQAVRGSLGPISPQK